MPDGDKDKRPGDGPSKILGTIEPNTSGEEVDVVMIVRKKDGQIVIKRTTRSGPILLQHD
jgi:hypothetical protein